MLNGIFRALTKLWETINKSVFKIAEIKKEIWRQLQPRQKMNLSNGALNASKCCDSIFPFIFIHYCKFNNCNRQTKCIFDCQVIDVKAQCNENSVAFMKGLTKSGLDAGRKLLNHANKTMPADCLQFINSLQPQQ